MYRVIKLKRIKTVGAAVLTSVILVAVTAGAFCTFAEKKQEVKLPVLMYHGVRKDPSSQGKYVVSPEELESDLQYISDNGYTAVFLSDVIKYVYDGKPLPEKPIVLSFDDGCYNNYTYAFPLVKKYGAKMSVSVIGAVTDEYTASGDLNASYGGCTWSVLREMIDSGFAEVLNHTYDLHHNENGTAGVKRKQNESIEKYRERIFDDISHMQDRLKEELGSPAEVFTYPFGIYNVETQQILRSQGFKAVLVCEERINTVTDDPECLMRLGRFIRPGKENTEKIFSVFE